MKLTFLEAKVPLTKSYEQKPDGSYVGGSYPGVTNFTSHVEEVTDAEAFFKSLTTHSSAGHCLLTNSLIKQINNESRRKLSDKEELRQWIVLDIDGIENITDASDFIQKCLPKQFQDVSYIVQHSPSSGIKPGIRVHVFFMLYEEVDVGSVSAWLKSINLDTQLLSDQITLSKNSMALSLKLDWVANNNGRIVYITSPECKNFSDPVTNRIQFVKKKYDTVSFNFAAVGSAQMRTKYKARLNELRTTAGLPVSRKADYYVVRGDQEYVIDSLVETARITSPEADNERFMRCNLDGGDSYAYYYFRHNPVYLYNFKGEPAVKMKLVDPEYYQRVAKPDMEAILEKENSPFVFRDHDTDKYYLGVRKESNIVVQPTPVGSSLKIEDYFMQFGNTAPPSPIPTWDRVFDPTSDIQWNQDDRIFNTWRPTKYQENPTPGKMIPSTIMKLLRHVLGGDAKTEKHFINWLAYIYQNRNKSGTAWVIHGCPGTGKGVLFHNVIRPIFGVEYCQLKQIRDLQEKFNGWMEQCIFVNVDEANVDDTYGESRSVINALKNWITEPSISIRHMQASALSKESYVNFIFTTNDYGILQIQDGDRRFNVAPRQEQPIQFTEADIANIGNELKDFAGYLSAFEVDAVAARTPLENEAKEGLKLAAENSIDIFFRALREGDLEYFIDGLEESSKEYDSLASYKAAVNRWIGDARSNQPSEIPIKDIRDAHIVMCRDKTMKLGQFRSMAAKRGSPPVSLGKHGVGWIVNWKISDEAKIYNSMHLNIVSTEPSSEAKIADEFKSE